MELYQNIKTNTREYKIIKEELDKFFLEYYKSIFISKLGIQHNKNEWRLILTLDQPDVPLHINYQGDIDGFIECIKHEIKNRNLNYIDYYHTTRTEITNESRLCNQQGEELG